MGWRLLVAAALAVASSLAAGAGTPIPLTVLPAAGAGPLDVGYLHALLPRGSIEIARVAAGDLDARFSPGEGTTPQPLAPHRELWVAARVMNPRAEPQLWTLQVRQTSLDEVAFYQPEGASWRVALAGDRVPQSAWSQPGRFPRFDVQMQPHETRTFYLRIRNDASAPVPLQLAEARAASVWAAQADFGLAFSLGALALLALASFVQAALYRDTAYLTFGGYALALAFALAAMSGTADHLLWGDFPEWADSAKTAFPLAAAGMSVWLVEALCRIRTRSLALARVAAALGGLVVATGVACAVIESAWPPVVAGAMLVATCSVLFLAGWTWRRGDGMGAWVIAAHVPIMATTALIVLRMYGIEPIPFRANVLVSASIGVILLLMLVALVRRSRELLSLRERARGMESFDPLTGMLSGAMFGDRVRAAVERFARSRHDAAVIYVRLANFDRIRDRHGLAVAEQSIIRAAMKLQRVIREADCFGRVGEGTLGLIVETVTRRDALLERASRLVAHGLMPLPGLKPEVTLVLHVAINVLSENPLPARELQDGLASRLAAMAARSRKPIRFLEPAVAPALSGEPAGEGAGRQRLAGGPEIGRAAVIEHGA